MIGNVLLFKDDFVAFHLILNLLFFIQYLFVSFNLSSLQYRINIKLLYFQIKFSITFWIIN